MASLFKLIRNGLVLGALGVATLSILALFGSMAWTLDLLNHGQILLLPATLIGLVVVTTGLRGPWRGAAMIYVFMGVAASANIMVPEFISGLRGYPPAEGRETITMMTHNLFGKENPDIIVFQEYFGEQATDLQPLLQARYPYFVRCSGGKRANLGMYSRLPIRQVNDDACPSDAYGTTRTAHILAEFKTPQGKPFSVITTHMDWPIPVQRQREQLSALSQVLDKIEGPLILAGDFNATPWSYSLREFEARNGLTRATVNLVTYPMRLFLFDAWRNTIPFLPLDHVMTRGGVVVHALHAGPQTGSDHLPVVFSFSVE